MSNAAISRHADAEQFLQAAAAWLLAAEAENNLVLGIALGRRGHAADTTPAPYWATLSAAGSLVGCACRTPPYPLVVTRMPSAAVRVLAEHVNSVYESLTRVTGPSETAEGFANAWTALRGGSWKVRMRLRIHELSRVSAAALAEARGGALRKATRADLPLAGEWFGAFVRETGIEPPPDGPVGAAARMIEDEALYFWTDADTPLSMAAAGRETVTGCVINCVYTPPSARRRGHATAAVAALSSALLASGRKFCCLYTDVADPTANSIYAKIGYEPIRDDVEIVFQP